MLDTDHAGGARRVDELVAAERDRNMSGPGRDGTEEEEISRGDSARRDRLSGVELIGNRAWQDDPVSREHVLREPAAVEPRRVGAAVSIPRSAESECGASERVG